MGSACRAIKNAIPEMYLRNPSICHKGARHPTYFPDLSAEGGRAKPRPLFRQHIAGGYVEGRPPRTKVADSGDTFLGFPS